MHILFVTQSINYHGANRSLVGLIDGLATCNVQSFVVAPKEGAITEILRTRGIPVSVVPFEYWMWRTQEGRQERMAANMAALPAIRALIKNWSIDLVYSNSSCTPVGAFAADESGVPHIWHVREFGELDYGLILDWGDAHFQHWLRKANGVIANSCAVRDVVLSTCPNAQVIYNGILTEAAATSLPMASAEPSDARLFCLVGQISRNKNQEQAIDAIAALRAQDLKVRLVIAGEDSGSHARELKKKCADRGLTDRVTFLGYRHDPFSVMLQSDAALMCSKNEAFGRVTAEAMFAGLPVIGADNGGTGEIIRHEENGLLYDGTTVSLVRAMRRFVEDPIWAQHLGRSGRAWARQTLTIERYAKEVLEAIRAACRDYEPAQRATHVG